MPLNYRIDDANGLVTITGDYASPDDWHTLLTTIERDPACRPGLAFLRDLRQSQHPVSAQAVMGIIGVVRALWPRLGVKRAAMVTRPGIDVPAVIAHALAEDEQMPLRAFDSYDDALAWLTAP